MVKSHANAVLFALIVSIPNIHVSPRRGRRTMDAVKIVLDRERKRERQRERESERDGERQRQSNSKKKGS